MKQKRKKPCKECPFKKKSIAGWLGPWDAQGIIQQAHSETGLACHVDVESKLDLPDDELQQKSHVCVGSLQNANVSCKSFRNPELAKMAKNVGTNLEVMNVREFLEHHKDAVAEEGFEGGAENQLRLFFASEKEKKK